MSISALELPNAVAVTVDDASLAVEMSDGRTIVAPLAWFPRLLHATPAERARWRLIGEGEGVHWPDLDEDVSVESLIAGRASTETADSLARWLAGRKR
jgi:hypothetical protein